MKSLYFPDPSRELNQTQVFVSFPDEQDLLTTNEVIRYLINQFGSSINLSIVPTEKGKTVKLKLMGAPHFSFGRSSPAPDSQQQDIEEIISTLRENGLLVHLI